MTRGGRVHRRQLADWRDPVALWLREPWRGPRAGVKAEPPSPHLALVSVAWVIGSRQGHPRQFGSTAVDVKHRTTLPWRFGDKDKGPHSQTATRQPGGQPQAREASTSRNRRGQHCAQTRVPRGACLPVSLSPRPVEGRLLGAPTRDERLLPWTRVGAAGRHHEAAAWTPRRTESQTGRRLRTGRRMSKADVRWRPLRAWTRL